MRRHALISRSQRHHTLAHNIKASHQPLHARILGQHRLSSLLIPQMGWETARVSPTPLPLQHVGEGWETARVSPTPWVEENVGETLAVSQTTDETAPLVGIDLSRPVAPSIANEDERMPTSVGINLSRPIAITSTTETETLGTGNRETLAVSQPLHDNSTAHDENENPQVGTNSSRPMSISTADEDVIHRSLQEQQEHHEQPEHPPTPQIGLQPKRGRIVEHPTTTENTLSVPSASNVTPPTASSKNANMYRTNETHAPRPQATEADMLFTPRSTDDRSPQAWAARLFKIAQPEQAPNEPSFPVLPVTDATIRLNEVGTDVSRPVGISTADEDETTPSVGTDVSRPGLGSIADGESENLTDRESKIPPDRELTPPPDAHEGLPYYTTGGRAKHVQYSRVAPRARPSELRGRPSELRGRPVELPEQTRFVAPLLQPTQPIQLSQQARTFLRPLVGIDPTDVSIYQDTTAAQVTDTLNADAVTLSANTIALAPEHLPDTPETLALLAHELTHVARRQSPRFVPPVVRPIGNTSPFIAPHVIPIVNNEGSTIADVTGEEAVAERVEQAVLQAAQGQDDAMVTTQLPHSADSTEIVDSSQSSSAENIIWGGLPAPWEPLPDWLAMPAESTPISPSSANTFPPSQAALYQRSEATNFGDSELAHTTHSVGNGNMVEDTGIQRAGRERALEQEDTPTPSASTPAQTPEPDLDALARQVYSILKRRLEVEYRRS